MRQVTAATIILALLATSAPPALAQDSAQGLRDAIDANTAERVSADAAADSEQTFLTDDELDELVAPVALYPDALLAQVLVAATYPLQVVEAERLLKQKDELSQEELADRLKRADWDPSVTVLASGFPTVVERMSDQLEWTEKLGGAMLNQDDDVLAAVQRKRAEAEDTGYLADNSAQVVSRDDSGSIAIRPADPKVVYVPSYDPEVVYTSRPTTQPYIAPVTQAQSPIANPLVAGALAFGAALLVEQLFGDDDDNHSHKNQGWDGYWSGSRPIDWRDRQFYPRPTLYGAPNDYRDRSWGWERDRYWDPQDRRWLRDSPDARRQYEAQRRDALGWLVVDDPDNGRSVVRGFGPSGPWTENDARLQRIAEREANERQQAEARADRLENRVDQLNEQRRADAIAAERREARTRAAAAAAQQEAKDSAAQATKDAKARAAAEQAQAKAEAKAAAAKQAAADAKAAAARDDAERKAATANDRRDARAAAEARDRARADADAKAKAARAAEADDAKRKAADAKAKAAADDKADAKAKAAAQDKADAKSKAAAQANADAKAKAAAQDKADARAKAAARRSQGGLPRPRPPRRRRAEGRCQGQGRRAAEGRCQGQGRRAAEGRCQGQGRRAAEGRCQGQGRRAAEGGGAAAGGCRAEGRGQAAGAAEGRGAAEGGATAAAEAEGSAEEVREGRQEVPERRRRLKHPLGVADIALKQQQGSFAGIEKRWSRGTSHADRTEKRRSPLRRAGAEPPGLPDAARARRPPAAGHRAAARRAPLADARIAECLTAADRPAPTRRAARRQAKACGCAARAMWSRTPLTNLASLPSG